MSDSDPIKFRPRKTDPEPLQRFVNLVNEHARIPRDESFHRIVETEWEYGRPSRFVLDLAERTIRLTPHQAYTLAQAPGFHPLTPADVDKVEYRDHKYTIEEGAEQLRTIAARAKAALTNGGPVALSKWASDEDEKALRALIPTLRRFTPEDCGRLQVTIAEHPDKKWVSVTLDGTTFVIPLYAALSRCYWFGEKERVTA